MNSVHITGLEKCHQVQRPCHKLYSECKGRQDRLLQLSWSFINVVVAKTFLIYVYAIINITLHYKEEPHTNIKDLPKVQGKRLHRQW